MIFEKAVIPHIHITTSLQETARDTNTFESTELHKTLTMTQPANSITPPSTDSMYNTNAPHIVPFDIDDILLNNDMQPSLYVSDSNLPAIIKHLTTQIESPFHTSLTLIPLMI